MRQIVDGIRDLMSEHSWAIDLRALDEMGDSVIEHIQDSQSVCRRIILKSF
jgi:hypothetical protein